MDFQSLKRDYQSLSVLCIERLVGVVRVSVSLSDTGWAKPRRKLGSQVSTKGLVNRGEKVKRDEDGILMLMNTGVKTMPGMTMCTRRCIETKINSY